MIGWRRVRQILRCAQDDKHRFRCIRKAKGCVATRKERMTHHPNRETVFSKAISEHLDVIGRVQEQEELLETIARAMAEALQRGNQIFW